MAEYNKDAVRLVKPYVDAKVADLDVNKLLKGIGGTLPSAADMVGQLFVKTGDNADLYVSTGTTTPGWKAVSHAQ